MPFFIVIVKKRHAIISKKLEKESSLFTHNMYDVSQNLHSIIAPSWGHLLDEKRTILATKTKSNRCWKFQLSILTNKTVLFLKKCELSHITRIVLFSTNRWRLDGAILEWRFWCKYVDCSVVCPHFWAQCCRAYKAQIFAKKMM